MYDIFWTIVIVWFVWKIVDAFRAVSANKKSHAARPQQDYSQNSSQANTHKAPSKKHELKPGAGEYIDFEEIK